MKKILLFIIFVLFNVTVFSQTNNTVDIENDIYNILNNAELRGICEPLSSVKPYTKDYIEKKIEEIIENLNESNIQYKNKEIDELELYKKKNSYESGTNLKQAIIRFENEKDYIPISLNFHFSEENFISSGFYTEKEFNTTGYEAVGNIMFFGDIGNNISYNSHFAFGATKMPLVEMGTYDIGYWWYDFDPKSIDYSTTPVRRIKKYKNFSVLPFSYKKFWDGSVYNFKGGMNAAGLKGWASNDSGAFGLFGEISGSFYDNLIHFSIGRFNREWGAMDKDSSLVFNSTARPMFSIEAQVNPFSWLSLSSLTGFLEFPNQAFMLSDAWYITDGKGNKTTTEKDINDSYFFHNLFSITMLELNLKYLHWDFGSTVVMPNRFELGYSFPLIDKLLYQNNIGDYDNLGIFTNVKLRYPGIGYIWGSFFLDEMNSFTAKIFENTRCMFAYQGGVKAAVPLLPYTDISMRYTKVEPNCYTHQALSSSESQPYYPHYISENYSNNGESIGYYLPPNSDELFVQVNTKPFTGTNFGFGYQFIRHGVDWGSESNMYSGSSIYSELTTGPLRGKLRKYFLHDGTYEWYNIFNLTGAYDFNANNIPVQVYCSIGYVHNWFSSIGNAKAAKRTPYKKINTDEYKETRGCVVSVGLNLFKL